MTSVASLNQARETFREGMERGTAWLLGQQQPDGSMNGGDAGLSTYYKSPFALASRGEVEVTSEFVTLLNEMQEAFARQ